MVLALLCARALVLLFAARPDNRVFAGLIDLTTPFVWLFRRLDAGQPQFGARLEFSTLAVIGLLVCVMMALNVRTAKERA
jgi:uncharacterized protein YggT (Ycf19 family)